MPEFELVPVLSVISGTVLLYSAATNRKPLDVIRIALNNGDLSTAEPIMVATLSAGLLGTADPGISGPGAPDSLGLGGIINDLLGNIGIDGTTVIIPYAGHPIGSSAKSPDVPGFMGGVAGKNSSYPTDDSRYNVAGAKPAASPSPTYTTPLTGGLHI